MNEKSFMQQFPAASREVAELKRWMGESAKVATLTLPGPAEIPPEEMTTAQLVDASRALIGRVPAAYARWGHQRTVEFKAAALKVTKHLSSKQPVKHLLLRDFKALKVFY